MKQRARDLIQTGDRLFSARSSLMSLWQEIAEHFYPERADFTSTLSLGDEFGSGLVTSAPTIIRRDLANQFNAMLRPREDNWFEITPDDNELAERGDVIEFSDDITKAMRRAMYDPAAKFTRATTEADNDFASFGQAIISTEYDLERNKLLYRCWHTRDVAWAENDRGDIDYIHRNWKMQARALVHKYGDKGSELPQTVKDAAEKEPFKEFTCRHIIVPIDEYDYKPGEKSKPARRGHHRFMSIMAMKDEDVVLFEEPLFDHPYVIPRWRHFPGSQYAFSPAAMIALPDARVIQRIAFTLLDASEKAANPPMVATEEATRSDLGIYPGGVTWVDAEYDERNGAAIRPLEMDYSGLKFGWEMAQKYEEAIKDAFFLNKINLPAFDGQAMTATEIRVRTQEYIRAALPLFEPLESEYNGALCEKTFNLLALNNGFGREEDWPDGMRGAELKWQFKNPLSEAAAKRDAFAFQESANLLAIGAAIDPNLRNEWDVRKDFRTAMRALKATVIDEDKSDAALDQAAKMQELQAMVGMAQQGATAAAQVGKAVQSFEGVAA